MLRRFSVSFAIFSMVLDMGIVLGSMVGMTAMRPYLSSLSFVKEIPSTPWLPPGFYLLFPLMWVIVFSAFSIYDGKKYLRIVDELAGVTLGSVVTAIAQAGILFLSYRDVSRALFISFILLSFLICIAWRLIARVIFRARKDQLSTASRILVVGDAQSGQKIIADLRKTGNENNQFSKFLAYNPEDNAGTGELIRSEVQQNRITDLIFCIPHDSFNSIKPTLKLLDDLPLNIWARLEFLDLSFADTRVEDFSGIPMLDLRAPALSEFDQLVKRGFDLVFASITFILSLPVMLVVSILILLIDGTPVFFNQDRVGQNGRLFKIHKFRTMVKGAESMQPRPSDDIEGEDEFHKVRNDPRVTRLGRILRRLSLDEIPQLVNVLAGEMSIVGPRPELPRLVEQYERWQRKRLTVLPGITGWWQVTGRSDKMMHLHTEDDIYYVQNYSIWLDFQIILRTLWVVLIGRGAF